MSNSTVPTPRGTSGHRHRKMRARWKRSVENGHVQCSRCGRLIVAGEAWDLGHDDYDRSKWTGPEHRRCNRAAGGRKGGATRARKRLVSQEERIWSRDWL